MHPLLRNSFLQMRHSDINATSINLVIDDVLDRPKLPYDINSPFLTHPCNTSQACQFGVLPVPNRSRLAFLDWEIPQLVKLMQHQDPGESNRAMATLCDRLKNPELAMKAMECNILGTIAMTLRHRNKFMKSCSARLIETLAKHGGLGWQIVNLQNILDGLVWVLTDVHPSLRSNAALAIEALTKIPWVSDKMIEDGYLIPLNTALTECKNNMLQVQLLRTMENLAERDPDKCVELNMLRDMTWRIKLDVFDSEDEQILSAALRVLAQLGRSKKGHEEADELDTIKPITKALYNESSMIYTSAAMAMQALTLTTKSRWRARQMHDLPTRLVYIACKADNRHAQRYAMQVLNQLCELSPTRSHLLQYLEQIKQIKTKSQLLKKTKHDLIQNIEWQPYDLNERKRTSYEIPLSEYFSNKMWARTDSKIKITNQRRVSRVSVSVESL